MLEELLAIIIAIVIIIILGWLTIKIADKYFDWYYTRQENQRKEKYPELYEWEAEYHTAIDDLKDWDTNEVNFYKKQIDEILDNMKYYPEGEEKEFYERRLTMLKTIYADKYKTLAEMTESTANIRLKIIAYLEEHPEIDWMNGWKRKEV